MQQQPVPGQQGFQQPQMAPQQGMPQQGMPPQHMAPHQMGGQQPPGGGKSSNGPIMVVVAVVVGLLVAGGAWFLFLRDSSDETVQPDPVDLRDEAVGTMAGLEQCGESDFLKIPDSNIEVEPVTFEEEQEFFEEHKNEMGLDITPKDDPETQQVLDDMLEELLPDFNDKPFSITLIENEQVNAFAAPGANLYVTDALVDVMSRDELAFTVGHEISHSLCRHFAQSMEKDELLILAAQTLPPELIETLKTETSQYAIYFGGLVFSREDEYEADKYGFVLAKEAGYPPEAALSSLQVLADINNADGTPHMEIMSSHPISENRIEAIQYQIDNS